jgi:hypothetical protein
MIKKCEVCGAEYVSSYTQSKYCAGCRIEVKREQDREHEKRRVRVWQKPSGYHKGVKQTAKSVKNTGCTVEEIVRRAAAAGMTYGEYVAKMEG